MKSSPSIILIMDKVRLLESGVAISALEEKIRKAQKCAEYATKDCALLILRIDKVSIDRLKPARLRDLRCHQHASKRAPDAQGNHPPPGRIQYRGATERTGHDGPSIALQARLGRIIRAPPSRFPGVCIEDNGG